MSKKSPSNYLGRNFKKERTPDKITPERRSKVMKTIRSRDTKFEIDFITTLKRATRKYFETNVLEIKGKPDIVFRKYNLCVFLDSDFWHGWQYPRWKHLLKNDFWRTKIEANRTRDKRNTAWLRRNGWIVLRIWEHEINRNIENQIERILEFL